MKILMYRWKAYNHDDMYHALLDMGYEVEVTLREASNYERDEDYAAELTRQIRENGYDMMFSINFFPILSNVCEKCNIKYVAVNCDSPLLTMYNRAIYNTCNYIFTFDKTNYYEMRDMNVKNIFYMPLCVNTHRIDKLLEGAKDLEKYHSEISFVGSLYDKNSYDEIEDKLSDYLRGYFDAVINAAMDTYGEDILTRLITPDIMAELSQYIHLEKTEDSFVDIPLVFKNTFLGFKIAQLERKRHLIKLASKHEVHLYTYGNTENLYGVQVHDKVDYMTVMPKIFHSSLINLNFTIKNIKSGIPLRVFDVLGSGGFLITNFQAELPAYFENKKDLVYYESEQDLYRKADYYLNHEEERLEIARNGYNKVQKYHTYKIRLEQIFKIVLDK